MGHLVEQADIITPNLTEACILTGTGYHEDRWTRREMRAMAETLCAMGPKKIVITGIPQGEYIANYCYEREDASAGDGGEVGPTGEFGAVGGVSETLLRTVKVGTGRCGTGDIFAAIVTADAVNGVPFAKSVRKASRLIKQCILKSEEMEIPLTDGVCFEELLDTLKA